MALMEKFNMKELLERSWLREKETVYLVLLAVVVGVVSGYASLLLRFAIEWVSL